MLTTGFSREQEDHDHAEEVALRKLGPDPRLRHATLYSSLVPCGSRASRPVTCVGHIVAAGIPRVVFAWREGEAIAMCPDLICVLESVSGHAVGTETIRYGQRVTVVALKAPAVLTSPRGLEFVGPRAFGYDLDFLSVFDERAGAGV